MSLIYVARSVKLGKWAADVGLSKHVYKVGCTDEPLKPLIEAGWAGEQDWTLVQKEEVEDLDEADAIQRLARKEKMIDPKYYPRIRDTVGIFKVDPTHVESHIIVSRALAGAGESIEFKLKPADFGTYLIHNARRT
jgi:hypothetical protein